MKNWNTSQYWEKRFSVGDTPWDLSGATPLLEYGLSVIERLPVATRSMKKVLCPGAGRGGDAIGLVRKGYEVIAVDWSETAVAHMRTVSKAILEKLVDNLHIYHADFFALRPQRVDIVFEHTFYCAIDPKQRVDYVERVSQWLGVGGVLFGNFFVKSSEGAIHSERNSPPFFSSEQDLRQCFASKFRCLSLAPVLDDAAGRRGDFEWLGIFERT